MTGKRKKPNIKTMRCARCFMSTNRDKCPRCDKPTTLVKDLHGAIRQEVLE